MVVALLFTAGDHVPAIASREVGGSVNGIPEQISGIGLKVGVILGLTTTVKVAVVAHCPTVGVKV